MERTRTTSLIQSSRTNALGIKKKSKETNKTSEWRSSRSAFWDVIEVIGYRGPKTLFLIRPTQPRILPRYGDVLIVSAEDNICAVAIAHFD